MTHAHPDCGPNGRAIQNAYIKCALWSSDLMGHEIDPDTLKQMRIDASRFYAACNHLFLTPDAPCAEYWDGATISDRQSAMAGHDLWLTRCGHGAGFWDGDWPEPQATQLTELAEALGNVDLYLGDDGKVYMS